MTSLALRQMSEVTKREFCVTIHLASAASALARSCGTVSFLLFISAFTAIILEGFSMPSSMYHMLLNTLLHDLNAAHSWEAARPAVELTIHKLH